MWNRAKKLNWIEISSLLLCMIVFVAPSAAQQEPAREQPKRQMTDEEKVLSWKGERVILLGGNNNPPYIGDRSGGHEYYRPGNAWEGLPKAQYAGKTGVISEVRTSTERETRIVRFNLEITLDNSGEKIIAHNDADYLGFFAELEASKKYIGRTFWARGQMILRPVSDAQLPAGQQGVISVKNTRRVALIRTEFGERFHPIRLCFKTEGNEEGCTELGAYLLNPTCIDSRFDRLNPYAQCADMRGFGEVYSLYPEDPHKLFPGWTKATWRRIENGEIVIGMTLQMAQVACGKELRAEGRTPSGVVFSCRGKRFLVRSNSFLIIDMSKGRVVEFF